MDFVFDDKDLESDEALWALYERWCKAFGEERSREEMQRRFDTFKERVLFVDRHNKQTIIRDDTASFEVNMFADGKLAEQLFQMPMESVDRMPYSESPFIGRAGHKLFNKKPVIGRAGHRLFDKKRSEEDEEDTNPLV